MKSYLAHWQPRKLKLKSQLDITAQIGQKLEHNIKLNAGKIGIIRNLIHC